MPSLPNEPVSPIDQLYLSNEPIDAAKRSCHVCVGCSVGEVDAAAERTGARAEARARTGEEIGVDAAQIRRRAGRRERDAVERDRRLRFVVTVQRDRLRRIGIVRALRDVDAGQRVQRVGQRIGDAADRAVLIDVVRRHGDARDHAADDRRPAAVGLGRRACRLRAADDASGTSTSTSLLPSSSNALDVLVR